MTTFYMLAVTSGSPYTLGTFEDSGDPRLFNGDALYVYKLGSGLLKTLDGANYTDVKPQSGMGFVTAICQTPYGPDTYTYALGQGPTSFVGMYNKTPGVTGWSSGSTVPVGFYAVDAVADFGNALPILAASTTGSFPKVDNVTTYPGFVHSRSDSGFAMAAVLTDLELTE